MNQELPPVLGERMRDAMRAITGTTDDRTGAVLVGTRKPRIKSEAASNVPQSLADVNQAIALMGQCQRERDRIQADMNDELAALRERWEAKAKPYADQIKTLTAGVQLWCEANRSTLTQDGKTKTAALAAGEVSWRKRPPSVVVRCAENVLEALKALNLTRFIRTKEEVNKEAVLAEPELAEQVKGLSISQKEDFIVKPWDTELEQVA